jgi:diguanylate cyclase (GGDEF)-like protein
MSFFSELRQLEERGIDLIEVLGQDRHLDGPGDLQQVISLLSRSTENLYCEILFYMTYRRFSPEEAEKLWNDIMAHKRGMQGRLERPVSFRVAALDFLVSNGIFEGVHLLARPEFEAVLSYVNVDEVTGVYSRRFFNRQIHRELLRARRYGSPLSLLLVDLDGFKTINDSLGHLEGDGILRRFGRLLRDTTREADSVCRFGGDEFAVLLPETNAIEAQATAERIRVAASRLEIAVNGTHSARLTVSIGAATYPADCETAEELASLADQMCLAAKRAGRNCARHFSQRSRSGEGFDLGLPAGA